MQQIEIFEIPSPCKSICEVNNRGFCKGCYRSREERFAWNSYSNAEKKKVIGLCLQRYKRYLQKQRTVIKKPKHPEQNGFDF